MKTEQILTGPISISGKGVGYFNTEIEKGRDGLTWEIQKEHLKHALPGDTVEVKPLDETEQPKTNLPNKFVRPTDFQSRYRQAEVVNIVSRAKMEFVGLLEKDPSGKSDVGYVVADDRRIYVDIKVPEVTKDVPTRSKVLVKITDWPDNVESPTGEIVEVIGLAGENETEMRAIALEKGFRSTFPEGIEAEAEAIKEHQSKPETIAEEIKNRRDMRDTVTFTIDPADAKDFDDALSIKKLPNGNYEIGVHIADVCHFVTPGTLLDAEAKKRALSVYLVDRTIPMLPEILSNDLCSLNAHEDKYTFSAVFEVTTQAEIKSKWFGRTVIHSDRRFTYEDAQKILDDGHGEFYDELNTLNTIGKVMEKQKFDNGAIDFEADEVKFVLDANGKPLSVYRKVRIDTNKLIEDFMLLANREVAEFVFKSQFEENKKPGLDKQSVYRIHDAPNPERIEELAIFLKALGYDLKNKDGEVTAKDINNLLHQVKGSAQEELIKTATLRSMAKAVYSTKNIGHFGLGFKYYAHFTSPIRRYPDLLVHRFLERELKGGKIEQDEFQLYEKICMECSEREKQASDAERGSIKYKQVEYMMDHVGETFEGTVTGVTDWGVYIEEKETKCEGMAKMKDIGNTFNDFFALNQKTYSISGEKTGKKITLGDTVKFKVMSADLEKKMLDYSIVG
jgi:ribonuclease R